MSVLHAVKQSSPLVRAQNVLSHAVFKLLLPVVRILMRHGMTYQSFAGIAKRAYVQAAQDDLGLPGKSQTKSRIALLTGLTRREVNQLLTQEDSEGAEDCLRWNRACCVLGQWVSDPVFLDDDGKPLVLPIKSKQLEASFQTLVRKHGSDMPYGAVLDELIHCGSVARVDGDKVRLLRHYYEPEVGSVEALQYVGMAGHRLLNTIEHNICRSVLTESANQTQSAESAGTKESDDGVDSEGEKIPPAFYQQEVWSKAIPPHRIETVRLAIRDLLKESMETCDGALEKEEELPSAPHHRVAGIGMYYFEVD